MALPVITCAACGVEVTIPRKWSSVRKYCNLCQIARDCAKRMPPSRECTMCGKTFWPVRASKTWDKCADCATFHSLERLKDAPTCNVCHKTAVPADGLEETCLDCVQSMEGLRDGYVRKVREIISERIKSARETVLQ